MHVRRASIVRCSCFSKSDSDFRSLDVSELIDCGFALASEFMLPRNDAEHTISGPTPAYLVHLCATNALQKEDNFMPPPYIAVVQARLGAFFKRTVAFFLRD